MTEEEKAPGIDHDDCMERVSADDVARLLRYWVEQKEAELPLCRPDDGEDGLRWLIAQGEGER